MSARRNWVSGSEPLPLTKQCSLSGVARSGVYAQRTPAINDEDYLLLGKIDAEYTRHPFYGSRRMAVYLRGMGHNVNRKRIQRLMGMLSLAGMAPGRPPAVHIRNIKFILICCVD